MLNDALTQQEPAKVIKIIESSKGFCHLRSTGTTNFMAPIAFIYRADIFDNQIYVYLSSTFRKRG